MLVSKFKTSYKGSIEDIFIDVGVGRLKSIYLTPTERCEGLNTVDIPALPYVKVMRFKPEAWFDDEIVNAYINLCRKQDSGYIASSLVYTMLVAHYAGQKQLVSVEQNLPCVT